MLAADEKATEGAAACDEDAADDVGAAAEQKVQ